MLNLIFKVYYKITIYNIHIYLKIHLYAFLLFNFITVPP